jgi:PAS domain S-box-containing protein
VPRSHPFGITFRINLIVLLTVMVLGGLLGTFFVVQQDRALRGALEARIRLTGEQVALHLGHAFSEQVAGEVEFIVDTMKDPEIAYVLVKAASGELLAGRWSASVSSGVEEHAFPILAGDARAQREAPESFGVIETAPGAVPVGTLTVGVNMSGMRQLRGTLVKRVVAGTLAAALVAAFLGTLLVRFILSRSIGPLVEGIQGVARGDLSRRVRVSRRGDEIGEIGRAFNEMAGQLATSLVTRSELEATVARRTTELTEALRSRERAQAALADREAHIRLLLESTAEAIYGIGNDGLCTFCNPSAVRALGYGSPEQLVGRNMHDLVHHSTGDGKRVAETDCRIYRTLREQRGYHSEEELLWRSDGTSFPVELWSYPMLRDGVPTGSVVTFLDLTERKRLEGELLKMRKLESLGVLAGGIAHDFNNLLMGILGNLTLAREALDDRAEAEGLLLEAEQATLRTRQLTQQLLTFSKGGLPVKKVISVRAVVEEASRFALSGSSVRGEQTFASDLWPIEADAGQLGQVVHNLVLNAAQAMPQGGVIQVACDNVDLEAGRVVPLPAGRYVRIQVRDQGAGISPEHLPRIFDPYFTTKAGGHGLGLASVFSIAQKHGGHVTVSSTLGRGTVFEVYLPAAGGAPAPVAPPPAPTRAPVRRSRILVMDDEPPVRKVAAAMLARLGYDVESAAEGAAAIELARAAKEAGRPFDLVILDLTIQGGMGGVETLERLRERDPSVVAVAASGYSNDPVIARFREYGFAAALAKPFTVDDLARVVGAVTTAPPSGASAG